MAKISLEKFIEKTKGKKLALPWNPLRQRGQCVSLIQHYIKDCLEQPTKPRGNAIDWINTYVNEGLGKVVPKPQKGDILVFPHEANGYGHIAIYIDSNTLYDQNNGRHDNFKAGYGRIFSNNYVVLRPNATLIEDNQLEYKYVSDVDYEGLVVHSSPRGPKKGLLKVGTKVAVYEKKGSWSRIGVEEWVYSKYLKNSRPSVKKVISTNGLNVRRARNTKNKPITCLKYGTPVQVFKTVDGWSKISPDAEAWGSSKYLK